ncbi:MAG: D-alanyl-D-alanine carboxypeptidase [Kiritimatiellae bacterium]|nr:D-alanyl-D-alanine carboxypeptidase [Kiritimatiellia bacterium]
MKVLLRILLAAALVVSLAESSGAAPRKTRKTSLQAVQNAKPVFSVQSRYRRSPYVGAISVDADTGRVLYACNPDTVAYPASVTKLMTAFLVLDDIKAGRLSLCDQVVASPTKTKRDVHLRQPSAIGLRPGQSVSVDAMLKAIMVKSANDAAVFLAEKCSGSMEAFVARMNEKARSLGMTSTKFYNPNGLPPYARTDSDDFNVSSCRDLAKMACQLVKSHPEILKYTSLKVCDLDLPGQGVVRFVNHNNVMVKDKLKVINPDGTEATDGLKTGYIDAGGSSVVITGKRGDKRAIVVVLGSNSAAERDNAAREKLGDALDALSF